MAISLRISKEDEELFKKYAQLNKISLSELIRTSVLEKIENDHDLDAYNKALQNYEKDSSTICLDSLLED